MKPAKPALSKIPRYVDVERMAAHNANLQGVIETGDLPGFTEVMPTATSVVDVEVVISKDAYKRYTFSGVASVQVVVPCRRCLQPMSEQVRADFALTAVKNDEQAREVVEELDPVLLKYRSAEVIDVSAKIGRKPDLRVNQVNNLPKEIDLYAIIEDELLLAVPVYPCHALAECMGATSYQSGQPADKPTVSVIKAASKFAALKDFKLDA